MSIPSKMNLLKDIYHLFLPDTCAMCGELLADGVHFICARCRWEVPLTGFCAHADNPVVRRFYGHFPINNATALIKFVDGSGSRDMIHDFKYRGSWKYALRAGEWFGDELAASKLYSDVDAVIPVPLHFRKRLQRGYNQSEYIAHGIASKLEVPVDVRSVVRSRHNPSQAGRRASERWENVEDIFAVRHPGRLAGKHILIVDDVLTTGATIISMAAKIAAAVPDCGISVAVLAASRTEQDV